MFHVCSGDFDRAIRTLEEARSLDPEFLYTLWMLGSAYGAASRTEVAIETLQTAADLSGQRSFYLSWLGWAYGIAQQSDKTEDVLRTLDLRSQTEYVPEICRTQIHSGLGDLDKALDSWSRACDERNSPAAFANFPSLTPLQALPKGREILQRLKLLP